MEERSLDRLGDEIAELSAHLDVATARLLDLIRDFDARGGWNTGFRSCAHWLSWRVGLDLGAAREKVRVARALGTLPRLAQALARGELSYAKIRALTRVATPETEPRLLGVGRAGTAEHVERIVRGWRRMDRKAETPRGGPAARGPGVVRVSRRRRHGDGSGAADARGGRAAREGTGLGSRDALPAGSRQSVGRRPAYRVAAAGGRAGAARGDGPSPRHRSRGTRGTLSGRRPRRCPGAGGP
jgi:Domain of unknown function (DUF222)